MAIDMYTVGGYIFPVIRTIGLLIVFLGGTIGIGYYTFVIKRRKTWHTNIWEKKADGTLQMVTKDVLFEKKINKGKQVIYRFKRQRAEAFPPPWECVYRVRGKEYCDYLRIREDFLPLKRELDGMNNLPTGKKEILKKIKEKLLFMRKENPEKIEKDYILIPINQAMTADIKFQPMEYDVNMMRINAIDVRDKIYADKKSFLDKYGTFIAFGLIVVLIIVVLYMSYEYSGNVINVAMGKADQTLSMVEQLAAKVDGVAPAS